MDDEVGSDASQFASGPAGEPECSSELKCRDLSMAKSVRKLRD